VGKKRRADEGRSGGKTGEVNGCFDGINRMDWMLIKINTDVCLNCFFD